MPALTYSPAEIVAQLLVDLGYGAAPVNNEQVTWPIYKDAEPGVPDNLIVVTDTQGTDDGRSMPTGEAMGHDGIQVKVRGVSHPIGWAKADAIRHGLAEDVDRTVVTVSGVRFLVHCLAKIGRTLPLGKDRPTSGRSLFTINMVVAITELG